MTMDTTIPTPLTPLFPDGKIYAMMKRHGLNNAGHIEIMTGRQVVTALIELRDDYEQDRARQHDEIAGLRASLSMSHEAYELRGRFLDAAQERIAELEAAAIPALAWIDGIYPADVFNGSSGDPGPVQIVAIRENLRRTLAE